MFQQWWDVFSRILNQMQEMGWDTVASKILIFIVCLGEREEGKIFIVYSIGLYFKYISIVHDLGYHVFQLVLFWPFLTFIFLFYFRAIAQGYLSWCLQIICQSFWCILEIELFSNYVNEWFDNIDIFLTFFNGWILRLSFL